MTDLVSTTRKSVMPLAGDSWVTIAVIGARTFATGYTPGLLAPTLRLACI